MKTLQIIHEIENAGISMEVFENKIQATGILTDRLRDLIRQNKSVIVKYLSDIDSDTQQDIREQIEERAAIMEYDGGLAREAAEQAASAAIRVYAYRIKDNPQLEPVMIAPDTELQEATERLQAIYGDRLLMVTEKKVVRELGNDEFNRNSKTD